MITNFGTTMDRESWEVYIADPSSPIGSISRERRNSRNQKANPIERGLVIRDKIINQSIFLPAVGALEIFKDMREVETWKRSGMIIGAPTLALAPEDEKIDEEILRTPFIRRYPEYVLSEPLRLTPEQSKDLFDFLLENEQLLTQLAEKDEAIARPQLMDLFKKIAEYGRKKRLNKSR